MDGWANGKCRGGFYFINYLFSLPVPDRRAMIPPSAPSGRDNGGFCHCPGEKRLTQLGGVGGGGGGGSGVSRGGDLERNLHNNVLPFRYQFVPTSKDRPHCDHSLCKVDPNPN